MALLLKLPALTRVKITVIIQTEGSAQQLKFVPQALGGQSVTGESSSKALFVVGDAFLDAASCAPLSQLSGYTVDGFLCCPENALPTPKNYVADGE